MSIGEVERAMVRLDDAWLEFTRSVARAQDAALGLSESGDFRLRAVFAENRWWHLYRALSNLAMAVEREGRSAGATLEMRRVLERSAPLFRQ